MDLPLSLTKMDLLPNDDEIIEKIVEAIYSMDEVHLLPI